MGNTLSGISTTKAARQIKAALANDSALYAFPDEPFYAWDHVRVYNLDHPTTPFCVTYPKTPQQVSAVVKVAAEHGLKVQAKSGGHSYCNFSSPDGGVVVDLKHFQGFTMDPETFVCEVGAGTLLEDLDRKLFKEGKRAVAHGVCPQVGLGGHATIGGLGPSSRKFGAALDHVEAVEMVLADGRIVKADASQNSDLFWAVRGAGASFGIITTFTLRTEPAPQQTVEYRYSFTTGSWADMAAVFKSWQRFIAAEDLSEDFASQATINPLGLVISGTFFGSEAAFDKLRLRPDFPMAHNTGHSIILKDWLGSLTHWAEHVALLLGGGIPARAYTKTLTFNGAKENRIPDAVVDQMFEYIESTAKDTLIWFVIFDLAGGAVNKVPMAATAFAHRDALFYLQAYAVSVRTAPVSKTTKAFLKGLVELIVHEMTVDDGKFTDYGAYPGYVDLEIQEPQRAYWRGNLGRLEGVKKEVDPKDVFHNPQSVRPDGKEVPFVVPEWAKGNGKNAPWWAKLFQ